VRGASCQYHPNRKKLLAMGTLGLRGGRSGTGLKAPAFCGPVMLPRKRRVPIASGGTVRLRSSVSILGFFHLFEAVFLQ